MKTAVYWLGALLVFGVMTFQVFRKERVIASGQTVLLRLAPVDPFSLIQGYYMELRYEMARRIDDSKFPDAGKLVIQLDDNDVGTFVRLHDGTKLGPRQYLLSYWKRGEVRIGAESFFFQQGKAKHYAQAIYGELKVDTGGESVLVGLRNAKFEKL